MFSKYEQRCFIKIQTARGKNARQCHTALLEASGRGTLPYSTISGRTHFAYQCHTGIIAVEQSVQRLVKEDAVNGIRRHPDVLRRVLHIRGIISDH